MSGETFLVTGAMGCIGAWVLRHLVDGGHRVVAADLGTNPARPRLLLDPAEIDALTWITLDVTDAAAVDAAVADNGVTRIVHLAGLQIPFCKADPSTGSAVNVTGTVNILEATRQHGVAGLAYASSLAVFGPPALYPDRPVPDSARPAPATLYGVYKVAGEEAARVYWQDWQVGSVGLRPAIVYGPGRDQGMSADIAKAILAVAAGRPFHIRFDGPVALHHASDVAQMFIGCALAGHRGAALCNIRNDVIEVGDFVALLRRLYPEAAITWERGATLPFPSDLDDSGLRGLIGAVPHIPLEDAIAGDVARFRTLIERGAVDLGQLAA